MNQNAHWDIVVLGGANTDYTVRGEQSLSQEAS
jgi:hypothetical protein